MPIVIKTPSQIADDYLAELKTQKPDVNTSQTDSDWWIRSRVVGGVVAGVYADQRLIANDAFPQRARHDALLRFLDLYFNSGFTPATQAVGNVSVTGDPGTVIPQSTQFVYAPNSNTYQSTEAVVLSLAVSGQVTGLVPVISVGEGQDQNLLPFAPLSVSSPPSGLNSDAEVDEDGLTDARDPETDTEARDRIVRRIREPLSVGRVSDYEQYAKAASTSVVSATVVRFPFGLGTVAVYITAGTTDIDQAIDNGDPITLIPSDELIAEVQEFLEDNKPVTDCVSVLKPSELEVDVEVMVTYASGDGDTILSGQTLTQRELVQREVKRALYKTPVGGRMIGASGYVLASDIEQTIDVKLSAETVEQGSIPILLDRQVLELTVTGFNRLILPSQVPVPGVITVTEF